MQHDHALKKMNFYLLTSSGGGGGVWVSEGKIFTTMLVHKFCDPLSFDMKNIGYHVWGVCRQNIWYQVAAFVILYNLICKIAT